MTHAKPIFGLAGGIGSGKSLVARQLAACGGAVFDADGVARAELDTDEVRSALVSWWGSEVLDASGCVDRKVVARHVFADSEARQRLEGLIHPRVALARIAWVEQQQADPTVRFLVLDVPLLFEVGLDQVCDRVIFVAADPKQRLERVARTRGWDAAELARREKAQWPLDRKQALAHDMILNDSGEAECLEQVHALLSRILD